SRLMTAWIWVSATPSCMTTSMMVLELPLCRVREWLRLSQMWRELMMQAPMWCILVFMKMAEKAVRQSVSLPPKLAKQVGSMAKSRKLSKNRMLLELIENGIDAEKRKQREFFSLAERFRNE